VTIIHNKQMAKRIRPHYAEEEIQRLTAYLEDKGTLNFPTLPNGLFPAAALAADKGYTGYSYIWVRDNIHVAHAHYAVGRVSTAVKNVRTLAQYFFKHKERFLGIIEGRTNADLPMNRPHIRFNGDTLEEVDEKWAHAQNDALGYFLWLFSKLVHDRELDPVREELELLALFPRYFEAIRFWEDEDSGHWEENRKISASSIGTVVAGLRQYAKLAARAGGARDTENVRIDWAYVESLIGRGEDAMRSILPAECIQPDSSKARPYDGALLFLIYPLEVIERAVADQILENVKAHLEGPYGIRRYLGDSYWAPDYKNKLGLEERTIDFSGDLAGRNRLLPSLGQEAQWCIFDPIVSCIYGKRFRKAPRESTLQKQATYLNRALGQITSEDCRHVKAFRCPELFYLEDGRYVPNDHVPLLWTQANLMLSLKFMQESCGVSKEREEAQQA